MINILTPMMRFYLTKHICVNLQVLSDFVTCLSISLLCEQGYCLVWSMIRGKTSFGFDGRFIFNQLHSIAMDESFVVESTSQRRDKYTRSNIA